MVGRRSFRVAVGGYHKQDVMTYIDQLTADAKSAEQKYQAMLSTLRQENTRLITHVGELENRMGVLDERLAEQKRRADRLEHQASALMDELSRCREAFDQNRMRAQSLAGALENKEQENDILRENLLLARQENAKLELLRRRLASLLLEAEADAELEAPGFAMHAEPRYQENLYSVEEPLHAGPTLADLEKMQQDLDRLGDSIANRLQDIDGFMNGGALDRTPRTPFFNVYGGPADPEEEQDTDDTQEEDATASLCSDYTGDKGDATVLTSLYGDPTEEVIPLPESSELLTASPEDAPGLYIPAEQLPERFLRSDGTPVARSQPRQLPDGQWQLPSVLDNIPAGDYRTKRPSADLPAAEKTPETSGSAMPFGAAQPGVPTDAKPPQREQWPLSSVLETSPDEPSRLPAGGHPTFGATPFKIKKTEPVRQEKSHAVQKTEAEKHPVLPPKVEKRWRNLGFAFDTAYEDEGYVEEQRPADSLFSAPIWKPSANNA